MGLVVLKKAAGGDILIDGAVIAGVNAGDSTADEVIDCSGLTLFPGFIDVHNHGAVGVDVNEADADRLLEIAVFLAKHGVTTWVPTLVPDSDANYRRAVDAIDRLMEIQADQPVAQAAGVHYEGIFANEKMCGALRPEFFKTFTDNQFLSELPRLKKGIHMTTFAPEVEGGVELARELTRQGWIASIGHTRADVETLDHAFMAGAKHVTHFFNAMTGIHHRDVGVAGWALTNPGVTFDIIADGIHVHPRMLEFACRRKSPDRSLLISDSVAPTGLGDGSFELWGETITVENGRTTNERGSIAGSVVSMLDAIRMMRSIGFSDDEVAKMASTNPAQLLGLADTLGTITVGKRADIAGLDADGNIKLAMIGGTSVNLG
jgi:N-acetylglucosamine-6-phosphate deacetylase